MLSYLPTAGNLAELAAALFVMIAMVGIGGLAFRRADPEMRLMAGLGLVMVVTLLVGVFTDISFRWIHGFLVAAGVGGLLAAWRRGERFGELACTMLLALPLLVLLSGAQPSQWDEFTNWLPKHRYLWDFDHFQRAGMPPSLSVMASYPDGLPLLGYFTARTIGHFFENAGTLINAILLVFAGALVARLIRATVVDGDRTRLRWSEAAVGLLAVTALCPSFVPKIVFTSYLDSTTAVALAFAAIAGWRALEALNEEDAAAARAEAWISGLGMAVLVNLKQANLVLAMLVVIGMAVAALRISRPPAFAISLATLLPRVVGPTILVWLVWRWYVARHIPGGEFSFRPLQTWLWHSAGEIALRMALIASKKGGYFILMAAISVTGLRALWRPATPATRLAIVSATVFLGYNAFLYIAYLGAFGEGEAVIAASYWRYNTELGVLGVVTAAYGIAPVWRRYVAAPGATSASTRTMAVITVVAILILPVILASRIRFDVNPAKSFVRETGAEIATLLPVGADMAVVDPGDNGFWGILVRYELGRKPATIRLIYGRRYDDPGAIRDALDAAPKVNYAWVHVPTAAVAAAVGLSFEPRQSYLLVRDEGAWRVVRSWRWPGYDDPYRYNN